jgi:phosphatidylinositol glycan class S
MSSPDQSPAFLLPQYGSVVIDNALSEHAAGASARSAAIILTKQDLQQPFAYFTHHLKALLGVPDEPPLLHKHNSPLSDWQVQNLLRMRTLENIKEATETLGGIQRLVAKIREMKVGLEVQKDVEVAVGYLRQVRFSRLPGCDATLATTDSCWTVDGYEGACVTVNNLVRTISRCTLASEPGIL